MLRHLLRRASGALLLALLAASTAAGSSLLPQDCQGPPQGLSVWFVDVGQGDCTLVRSPTGEALLIDGGDEGKGTAVVLPLLQSLNVTRLHGTVASHYHADHLGGLDDVLNRLPVATAYDRGLGSVPTTQSYLSYAAAASGKRRELLPGSVIDLGGGVRLLCIAVNGKLYGGGSVDIGQSSQFENSASVALRLDYGRFSMWLGGDLTGGGGGTSDVETPAGPRCGDVDVYQVNHHGSNTSSNQAFLSAIRPECAVFPVGPNTYGHPTGTVTNRLNNAAESRLLLATDPGQNLIGYTSGGTMRLDTDGERYRVALQSGAHYDLYVDEHSLSAPVPGELVVAELHRDPAAVADSHGEYLELYNVSGRPLGLRGCGLRSRSGSFTLAANYRLLPGERLLLLNHGNPADNGGIAGGHTWPYNAMALANQSDDLDCLAPGSLLLERVAYGSSFVGGSGTSAERIDLLAAPSTSNFAAATRPFGRGDRGTPAALNSTDRTRHPTRVAVTTQKLQNGDGLVQIHLSSLSNPLTIDVGLLAFGSAPGFQLGDKHVPLNPDALFLFTLAWPDAIAVLPSSGYRCVELPVPSSANLTGLPAVAGHLLLDFLAPSPVRDLSPAVPFRFP